MTFGHWQLTTLANVMEALGPPLLTLAAAPRGLDVEVRRAVLHDAGEQVTAGEGDLFLGVGLRQASEIRQLAVLLGRAGAAALILKPAPPEDVVAAISEAGLALLTVPAGASWLQLANLLQSVIGDDNLVSGEAFGGIASGDLFALANAIAALMDAPVTIEDPKSRVLAFSGRQEEADPARVATILGRQAPDQYVRRMREHGVFRRLYASNDPIFISGREPDILPRVAVAVRAGAELLGSIWVVVRTRPPREQLDALGQAARAASLHLLRHRLAADARRDVQADLMAAVLQGGPLAAGAAQRLGVRGGVQVLAIGVAADDEVRRVSALNRCLDVLTLQLGALHRSAFTAVLGDTIYSLVPVTGRGGDAALRELVRSFLQRLSSDPRERVRVGLGGLAESIDQLPRARARADQVLRTLLHEPAGPVMATLDDVWLPAMLLRFQDISAEDATMGTAQLDRLRELDRSEHGRGEETLRAWLQNFGDNEATARALGIHANTVRMRMRQLRELGVVNLDDPDQRLALLLQFRLEQLRSGSGSR